MKRRSFLTGSALALGAIGGLVACSNGDGTGDATPTADGTTPTSDGNGTTTPTASETGNGNGGPTGSGAITVWMLTQPDTFGEVWKEHLDTFHELHPDIEVTIEERGTDAHRDALRQVAGTGAGPDVFGYWSGPASAGALVEQGVSEDLTPYYEEYGWAENFGEAPLASLNYGGGMHGVPWSLGALGVVYNKRLFEEAGVSGEPTTYDELLEVLEQLQAAGIAGFATGGSVSWHVMRITDNLFETALGAEGRDALIDGGGSWAEAEGVTEAFEMLKQLSDNHFAEGFMSLDSAQSKQVFYEGGAAMTVEGTWFNTQIIDGGMDPADIGVFNFPTGTGRMYGGGENFYMNSNAQNKEAALVFLDYLTSAQAHEISRQVTAVPIHNDVPPTTDNPLNELWLPIYENATGAFNTTDQILPPAVTEEFFRVQDAVMTGDIAPGDAGATLQDFIDNA